MIRPFSPVFVSIIRSRATLIFAILALWRAFFSDSVSPPDRLLKRAQDVRRAGRALDPRAVRLTAFFGKPGALTAGLSVPPSLRAFWASATRWRN